MQESVASTACRATNMLEREYRARGMQAWVMIVLYDSVVTCCPLEERHVVAELHQRYMTDENSWKYADRTLKYPIDTEFNLRWSTKPTKEEKAVFQAA